MKQEEGEGWPKVVMVEEVNRNGDKGKFQISIYEDNSFKHKGDEDKFFGTFDWDERLFMYNHGWNKRLITKSSPPAAPHQISTETHPQFLKKNCCCRNRSYRWSR